ncbi:hypothetical protein BJX99DRAFT_33770 [Aspergillus californicus]
MNDLDLDMVRCARRLRNCIGQPLRTFKRQIPRKTIHRITLTLSDQQLITGTSLLIAVYADTCNVSQYHFKIAYYLGAASFLTHQSTVMMIRDLLKDSPLMRAWRMLWVIAIFAFVLTNNVIIYSDDFYEATGSSVQCAFPISYDVRRPTRGFLVATSVFWFWGLVAVVRDLCPELRGLCSKLLRPWLPLLVRTFRILSGQELYLWTEMKLEIQPRCSGYYVWLLVHTAIFPWVFLTFSLAQILSSTVIDLYRIFTSMVATTFGIWRMKHSLNLEPRQVRESGDDVWNFGQIMAVLILALPLFQTLELLYGGWYKSKKGQDIALSMTGSAAEQSEFAILLNQYSASEPLGYDKLKKKLYGNRAFRVWLRVLVLMMVAATCVTCTGLFLEQIIL